MAPSPDRHAARLATFWALLVATLGSMLAATATVSESGLPQTIGLLALSATAMFVAAALLSWALPLLYGPTPAAVRARSHARTAASPRWLDLEVTSQPRLPRAPGRH